MVPGHRYPAAALEVHSPARVFDSGCIFNDGISVEISGVQAHPAIDVVANSLRDYAAYRFQNGSHGNSACFVEVRRDCDLFDSRRSREGFRLGRLKTLNGMLDFQQLLKFFDGNRFDGDVRIGENRYLDVEFIYETQFVVVNAF